MTALASRKTASGDLVMVIMSEQISLRIKGVLSSTSGKERNERYRV